MSYHKYKELITSMVHSCEEKQLNLFAKDVISRMVCLITKTSKKNLLDSERSRIDRFIQINTEEKIDWKEVSKILGDLTKIAEENEEHSIEISSCGLKPVASNKINCNY